jgi:hypothetical protein
MEKKDVPQDAGIYGQWHGISYAVDENGKYMLARSAGWEPANLANKQAWEVLEEEIREIIRNVKEERMSPLAYHMARNLMDVKMLAQYAGLPRWRVKRHLKPHVFNRLDPALLEVYAKVLRITVEELRKVP